jgi:hypothetical protein
LRLLDRLRHRLTKRGHRASRSRRRDPAPGRSTGFRHTQEGEHDGPLAVQEVLHHVLVAVHHLSGR